MINSGSTGAIHYLVGLYQNYTDWISKNRLRLERIRTYGWAFKEFL